jgi:hypothetical protein
VKVQESRRSPYPIATLALAALAALACNAPVRSGEAITATSPFSFLTQTSQAALITPAYTETPDTGQPTPTLAPGVTPSPTVCAYNSSFVADVTIPDGSQLVAGTMFDKTWQVRNNGCLAWPEGTQLAFFSGEQMGGASAVLVPPTAIGDTANITATLRAPTAPGEYVGYWQLRTPDGVFFGPHVFVDIVVIAATGTPSATITTTPTVTATPAYQPFVGNWVNQSANTGGISRVEIRVIEGAILVHMWTKCAPTDCDYGETSTPTSDANDGVLTLNWVKSGYAEAQQLTILLDGRLQVNGQINYTDPGTQDASYTYFFVKSED